MTHSFVLVLESPVHNYVKEIRYKYLVHTIMRLSP